MIPKHEVYYKVIASAIDAWGERHNIVAREYLAPLLGFTTKNGSIMLSNILNYKSYSPASPKRLSIDHLAIILNQVDDMCRKEIHSGLLKSNYSNSDNQEKELVFDDVLKEYLNITLKVNNISILIKEAVHTKEVNQEFLCKRISELKRSVSLLEYICEA